MLLLTIADCGLSSPATDVALTPSRMSEECPEAAAVAYCNGQRANQKYQNPAGRCRTSFGRCDKRRRARYGRDEGSRIPATTNGQDTKRGILKIGESWLLLMLTDSFILKICRP